MKNLKLFERNSEELFEKYKYQFKECLLLTLNLIWDFIYEPNDIAIQDKSNPKKINLKMKKKEMTVKIFIFLKN